MTGSLPSELGNLASLEFMFLGKILWGCVFAEKILIRRI